MILSGRDLGLYIANGRLKIEHFNSDQFQQNGFDCVLADCEHKGGIFYLGCTAETFELPDDLMAFVGLRSTWARRGFMLPPTIVDAGFKGNLTIEIASLLNAEPPVGQRFAHLIFAKTSGPCVPYTGKYSGQSGITEAK